MTKLFCGIATLIAFTILASPSLGRAQAPPDLTGTWSAKGKFCLLRNGNEKLHCVKSATEPAPDDWSHLNGPLHIKSYGNQAEMHVNGKVFLCVVEGVGDATKKKYSIGCNTRYEAQECDNHSAYTLIGKIGKNGDKLSFTGQWIEPPVDGILKIKWKAKRESLEMSESMECAP